MSRFVVGVLVGSFALFAFDRVTQAQGIELVEDAARKLGDELDMAPVWLIETSTLGIAAGSDPTVLFFGYGDNLTECQRLSAVLNRISTTPSRASCELIVDSKVN